MIRTSIRFEYSAKSTCNLDGSQIAVHASMLGSDAMPHLCNHKTRIQSVVMVIVESQNTLCNQTMNPVPHLHRSALEMSKRADTQIVRVSSDG